MEERLAKVEQAYEDIRKDIESKLEKTKRETRDHISQAQEDLLAKIAAMLVGQSLEERKGVFIDPSALTNDPGLFYTRGGGAIIHNDPSEYVVPDFNEMDKLRVELPKQLQDRCKQLEEKFKAMESIDQFPKMDARELSLVPDLVLPPKFKMPDFGKYNGTTCPKAHLTMFIRRMT
ncbi:hypothetical protein HRI_000424100 [Hibiscus trionum]|uniref:Uncharacterized protein n=1 Tax=Hibiscus trionum TaxID=183268 RepID=A0A9W7LJY3_HIBTR|nr:hypothetical protein HRI_000424100 [Hibiscus trionum]